MTAFPPAGRRQAEIKSLTMPARRTNIRRPMPDSGNNRVYDEFRETYAYYIPESHKAFYSAEDLGLFLQARYEFYRNTSARADDIHLRVHNPAPEFFWLINSTVIEVVLPDSRFIVDTLIDYCAGRELRINLVIHPIFAAERDAQGQLQSVNHAGSGPGDARRESYVYVEISRLAGSEMRRVEQDLRNNLKELRTVVTDFPKMSEALDNAGGATRTAADWARRFFILLGVADWEAATIGKLRLGIFRNAAARDAIVEEVQASDSSQPSRKKPAPVVCRETAVYSTVNRRKPYHLLIFNGEKKRLVVAGHFASGAELQPRTESPLLADRLSALAEKRHAAPNSYTHKRIRYSAQMIPLGLLLTRPELIEDWIDLALANVYTDEIEYRLNEDPAYDMVWISTVVPGRDADSIPGRDFREVLREFDAKVLHHVDEALYRNRYLLLGIKSDTVNAKQLHHAISERSARIFSSWSHRFRKLIGNKYVGDANISQYMQRYFEGLAPDYELHQTPEEALLDLDTLEHMSAGDGYRVSFYARRAPGEEFLKVYSLRSAHLSEMVPVLSNFGFEILDSFTFPYRRDHDNGDVRYTYAFRVNEYRHLDREDRDRAARAVERALNKAATAEILDALVVQGGLSAGELQLVKALLGYYFQVDRTFSRLSLQTTLLKYPAFAGQLVNLFHAQLGPEAKPSREERCIDALEAAIYDASSVLEETLLRSLVKIVQAIVRTTYYGKGKDAVPGEQSEIAFKIASGRLGFVPQPVPFYEIYVYGYDIEGVHLRGGYVARGGIRWSDRADDFRTEVLGLMKAQMVKNTVIVPVGSKGGFVIKNKSFADRQAQFAGGQAAYRRYIGAMLDLTDNLSPAGKVIPVKGIVRRDEDDAYLVVAADKGTATFSDLANEISVSRGFWLSDAFASGGRDGYDHKKQGITAKGAWEAVRLHFYEMGRDPERDAVSVAAIGDMGGDVFGNGMLLSRSMRLLAAFNHLYIFLDPNPDPETSYKERERLFQEVGNWNKYDPEKISKGGGVFERDAKRIELSKEIREALSISANTLSGEELIRAILRAPVDLLWNGGIGTYVKASFEDDFSARDPANDRVRINGDELHAKVVGEGGNLGFTQAARIEAAHRGIRLNTDAVDNSAGVNMSDHEVNLKILLERLLRKNKIKDMARRNTIIRRHNEDMIRLVLATNIDNNIGLSLDQRRTPDLFAYTRALIKGLNRAGVLNRENDNIPFEADLDQREQGSRKLSRPVLCALTGFAKLDLARRFLDSEHFRDSWYDRFILRYFPEQLVKDYREDILSHPLKREIVITEALNDVMNHAGLAYFQRMQMRTDADIVSIADTYLRLSEYIDLPALRARLRPARFTPGGAENDRTENQEITADLFYEYLLQLEEKIFRMNKRLLEKPNVREQLSNSKSCRELITEAREYSSYRPPRELRGVLRSLDRETAEAVLDAFRTVDTLEDALNIHLLQGGGKAKKGARKSTPAWTTADYFRVLEVFRIDALRRAAYAMPHESTWELRFLSRIEASIDELLLRILEQGLVNGEGKTKKKDGDSAKALRKNILDSIEQTLTAQEKGTLNAAAFYEMLEHVRERVSA